MNVADVWRKVIEFAGGIVAMSALPSVSRLLHDACADYCATFLLPNVFGVTGTSCTPDDPIAHYIRLLRALRFVPHDVFNHLTISDNGRTVVDNRRRKTRRIVDDYEDVSHAMGANVTTQRASWKIKVRSFHRELRIGVAMGPASKHCPLNDHALVVLSNDGGIHNGSRLMECDGFVPNDIVSVVLVVLEHSKGVRVSWGVDGADRGTVTVERPEGMPFVRPLVCLGTGQDCVDMLSYDS